MKLNREIYNKLAAYFKQRLGMFDYKSGWMKGDCPMCGKSLKYGVNISQNRTNCFSCTYNERPLFVVMKIENLQNIPQTFNYLGTFEGATYLETPQEYLEEKDAKLPEGYKLLSIGNSRIAKLARNYMKNRGFNILSLSMKGVGYCTKGDYMGRIILPFYEKGKLVYFNARKFIDSGPKFKNPSLEEFGVGKNLLIYNVDALAIYKRINIVESITNSLTLGDSTISLGGKIMSAYQTSKILRSPVKEVVIILDSDAYEYAIKAALAISPHKKVKLVRMPENLDVNDIGKKETLKIIKQHKFLTYQEVLKEKFNYA